MLEIWITGHSWASKVTPFDTLPKVFYYHPIVTLCLKCTVFEIWRHIGRKAPKKTTPLSFDSTCPANPCKCMHKPYLARNIALWSTFLPLIVWVYLHSYFLWWAPKDMCNVKKRIMAVQCQLRVSQGVQ